MIKTEIRADGLVRTWSDVGKRIQKLGTDEIYDEAVDLADTKAEYAETDFSVEITAEEALEIITGGAV